MPEQISKYPELTIQVLKGAGARCGEGLKQTILTQCPAERFCSLKTGEICVYDIDQIPQMTQISTAELARVVCAPPQRAAQTGSEAIGAVDVTALGATFALGLVAGMVWRGRKAR